MRRFLSVLVPALLFVSACSSDGDDTGEPPATTVSTPDAPTTTAAPVSTSDAPSSDAIAVSLVEFAVDTQTELSSGPSTFAISNDGDFPHEFTIARGESYDALPQLDNGAIDEATLGDDIVASAGAIDGGATSTLEVDLEPGNYVFFCNITLGPQSHAAAGQVLSVTVS